MVLRDEFDGKYSRLDNKNEVIANLGEYWRSLFVENTSNKGEVFWKNSRIKNQICSD